MFKQGIQHPWTSVSSSVSRDHRSHMVGIQWELNKVLYLNCFSFSMLLLLTIEHHLRSLRIKAFHDIQYNFLLSMEWVLHRTFSGAMTIEVPDYLNIDCNPHITQGYRWPSLLTHQDSAPENAANIVKNRIERWQEKDIIWAQFPWDDQALSPDDLLDRACQSLTAPSLLHPIGVLPACGDLHHLRPYTTVHPAAFFCPQWGDNSNSSNTIIKIMSSFLCGRLTILSTLNTSSISSQQKNSRWQFSSLSPAGTLRHRYVN